MTKAPERILTAGSGGEIEYIRADLAKPRVKQLVWEDFPLNKRISVITSTQIGTYSICQMFYPNEHFAIHGPTKLDFEQVAITLEAAKVAAQSDYERRILEALE